MFRTVVFPSEQEKYSAWWNSPDVRAAKERSGYEQNGDLVGVMEHLLEVCDEHEVERDNAKLICGSVVVENAAFQYAQRGRVFAPKFGAIIQMLDIGAEPERLRRVFLPEAVDRELAKWRPWRADVLALARKRATGEQLRQVTPPGTRWSLIRELCTLHGFDYPEAAPETPTQASAAALRLAVMTEYQKGGTIGKVAARAGCTPAYVKALLYGIRHGDGLYAGLDRFLVRAAA